MILRRLGNKSRIADKIYPLFPKHDVYIEPFFGAGGMFFNKKPIASYNILNDIDNDVFNLFEVIQNNYEEFKELLTITPYHKSIFDKLKNEIPTCPIRKALRFVYLSNYSLYGAMDTIRIEASSNCKKITLDNLEFTRNFLSNCNAIFYKSDAISFLEAISFKNKNNCFVYCDPPYLGTMNNYSNSFTYSDLRSLIEKLLELQVRFAISEYNNEVVLQLIKEYQLNYVVVKNVYSINKKQNIEILFGNYNFGIAKLF